MFSIMFELANFILVQLWLELLNILDSDLNVCHFMAMLRLCYLTILLHYLTLLKLLQQETNQHLSTLMRFSADFIFIARGGGFLAGL